MIKLNKLYGGIFVRYKKSTNDNLDILLVNCRVTKETLYSNENICSQCKYKLSHVRFYKF